jgi:hypothetical protein
MQYATRGVVDTFARHQKFQISPVICLSAEVVRRNPFYDCCFFLEGVFADFGGGFDVFNHRYPPLF